jgi:hypothetical protein
MCFEWDCLDEFYLYLLFFAGSAVLNALSVCAQSAVFANTEGRCVGRTADNGGVSLRDAATAQARIRRLPNRFAFPVPRWRRR